MPRRDRTLLSLATLLGLAGCSQLGGSTFTSGEPTASFEVLSRHPAPGTGGVLPTTMISIGFSAPLDPGSVREGSVTLNGTSVGRLEVLSTALHFYPAGGLVQGTSYEVRLGSALRSIDGENLGPTPAWGFKTAGVPPTPENDTTLAAPPRPR